MTDELLEYICEFSTTRKTESIIRDDDGNFSTINKNAFFYDNYFHGDYPWDRESFINSKWEVIVKIRKNKND